MKKTKIISLALSLAMVISAFVSVNMISASADAVKVNYDFDTTTPTFTIQTGSKVTAEVIDAGTSFNTTKALKIGSSDWNNYTQACVVVDVDATDASNIIFDAGQEFGFGSVEPHYGIVYNGDIYWDATGQAGNIYTNTHDGIDYKKDAFFEYSIVGHKFYKFTGDFGSATDTESITFTSDNVSGITGLAFKPVYFSGGGYLLVDNIRIYEAAAPYDTTVDVSMVAGASIRIGANNGIRYITNVDADKIAELESNGYTVDMGTLIAPADLLGSDELTFDLDSSKFVDVVTTGFYADDQIAGSIKVNLNKNIAREFVGRGYVKVSKDGVEVATYYATLNDNTRSLKTLANSWINDPESFALLNDDQKVEITAWANA